MTQQSLYGFPSSWLFPTFDDAGALFGLRSMSGEWGQQAIDSGFP